MARARGDDDGHRFDGLAEKVEVDPQAEVERREPPAQPAPADNARQAVRAARVRAARTRGPVP